MRARTVPAHRALVALSWLAFASTRLPTAGAPREPAAGLPGHVVDVVARDFFLAAPDTIPAGLTTLRLRVPQGDHIAILVRLDAGHTAAELLRERRAGRPRPPWTHLVGGPGFPAPGGTANATAVLAPGHYLLLCDVAGPDGVHHVEKGMFRPLVVRATGSASRATPQPDAVVTMRDHVFALSGPLRAGARVLRVVNAGTVLHEFRLVRVLPGHTGRESLAWTPGSTAPRPDEDVTALVGIPPGAALTTSVALAPGEYVALCVPQLARGMIQVIRVVRAAE